MAKKKIIVIHGPNINLTGEREATYYGKESFASINAEIMEYAAKNGLECEIYQSNIEGEIINKLQAVRHDCDGIVMNAGAFTHYSYAIRDALASITIPKVEIHISDITKREEFRKISVTKDACDHQIYGKGLEGYCMAIDFLLKNDKK